MDRLVKWEVLLQLFSKGALGHIMVSRSAVVSLKAVVKHSGEAGSNLVEGDAQNFHGKKIHLISKGQMILLGGIDLQRPPTQVLV